MEVEVEKKKKTQRISCCGVIDAREPFSGHKYEYGPYRQESDGEPLMTYLPHCMYYYIITASKRARTYPKK